MIGITKLAIVAVTASLLSGGALLALTGGAGPIGDGSDYGIDTDGDGAFDWLVVAMTFRAEAANYYNLWGTLGTETPIGDGCWGPMPPPLGGEGRADPGFQEPALWSISWASAREFLEPGDHRISLAFPGTDIGRVGVDGPYVVQVQVYADGSWGDGFNRGTPVPGPAPEGWTWEYTTGAYDAETFETPRWAIRFTDAYEDAGADIDGDGLFEYLVLRADVRVDLAGTYSYDGYLTNFDETRPDNGGVWIGSYGSADLAEGDGVIEVRFNGGDLWASGASGAFDFTINVYFGGGWNGGIREGEPYPPDPVGGGFDLYGDTLCGATGAYRHEQWEERVEPATFTGAFADRGVDTDGDGLYDLLAVDAEINVTEANSFDFFGQLMSEDGAAWITGAYAQAYLEVGVQTLTLEFPGPDIRSSGVDGPYRVDMNLVVAMRDPQATYTTGAYDHAEFDEAETGTRGMYWIADVAADATTIKVTVQRGNDMLAVVIEDVLTVQAIARDGTVAFEGRDKVYLPSGGSSQSFSFSWAPAPGTYVVRAVLGDASQPQDVVEIVVTV